MANWLEYPVWLWSAGERAAAPRPGEVAVCRLDIRPVRSLKRRAVGFYRSQITGLIDDDPNGFRLSPAELRQFDRPYEVFFAGR